PSLRYPGRLQNEHKYAAGSARGRQLHREDEMPVNSGQCGRYKKRPVTLNEPLFHAPLPNVFSSGNICWGTVQRVTDTALQTTNLAEDWAVLLGSRFNDHGVGGKSKSHPMDIRQMLIALEGRKARAYPKSDLLPVKKTLAQVLGDEK
ncbi:MAG: hypothetical protein SNJ54_00005, partial [Anaerolineae bacterium]